MNEKDEKITVRKEQDVCHGSCLNEMNIIAANQLMIERYCRERELPCNILVSRLQSLLLLEWPQ